MIRPPAFWWATPPSLPARLLAPIAAIYGALTIWRMGRQGRRAACPVVCIGNFTVGGAGKTPTAILVARMLLARGHRPVFLSRGFGGTLKGPVTVDPSRHAAAEVGDEPLLLARAAPVVVAADRVAGAALAHREGASVIIMDDGLQNPSLSKDLTIAVIDGGSVFGNGQVFPAGPLRARVSAQAAFAHAALVIGECRRPSGLPDGLPLIAAWLRVSETAAERLRERTVIAMAGIGLPEKFVRTLEDCGAIVAGRHFVPDHGVYSAEDLESVASRAGHIDALVATTEKDAVRLGGQLPGELASRLLVVPVTLEITSGLEALETLLDRLMEERQRPASAGPA